MILRENRYVNRSLAESDASLAVELINAASPPVPRVPASLAAMATMNSQGPVTIRNRVVLDSNTVNSIISQQSATNATLSPQLKRSRGVLPGIAGVTLQQVTRPGMAVKPGSAAFIQSKLNMGMKYNAALNPRLLTGNSGVRTVNELLKNPTTQIAAVRSGLQNAATGLINRGVISGIESSVKTAGLITAAGAIGNRAIADLIKNPKNVVEIFKSRGTELAGAFTGQLSNIGSNLSQGLNQITGNISQIKDLIASGNFASSVADQLKGGLGSIAGNLAGALGGVVGNFASRLFGKSSNVTLSQLFNQFKDRSRAAYIKAKQAFGEYKPNVPNYTNGVQPQTLTDTQQFVQRYESAQARVNVALENLNAARAVSSEIGLTQDSVAVAQREYEAAQQQLVAASTTVLSPIPKKRGGLFGGLKGLVSNVTENVRNSTNEIIGRGTTFFNSFKRASEIISKASATGGLSLLAESKVRDAIGNISNPKRLLGNLVGKTTTSIYDISTVGGKLGQAANGQLAKLGLSLGGLGGGSLIKAPTVATDTDPIAPQITSKTAQLLGSDIVPLPPQFTGPTAPLDVSPNAQVIAQRDALQRINVLEAELRRAELEAEKLYAQTLVLPEDAGKFTRLESARQQINTIRAQLITAQDVYANTVQGA